MENEMICPKAQNGTCGEIVVYKAVLSFANEHIIKSLERDYKYLEKKLNEIVILMENSGRFSEFIGCFDSDKQNLLSRFFYLIGEEVRAITYPITIKCVPVEEVKDGK